MKKLIALLTIIVSTFSFAAEEPKADPIIGTWRGFRENRVIECKSDGKFVQLEGGMVKPMGVWQNVESKSVERKYRLTWLEGKHEHELTMNRDMDRMTGTSLNGKRVDVVRVKP